MNFIFVNNKSNNGQNNTKIKEIVSKYENNYQLIDVFDEKAYNDALNKITNNDEIVLIGGDGTLNHFINKLNNQELPCKVYYYSSGTGNDFINDIKNEIKDDKICLNEYIKNLPYVIVNEKKYYFINGIGYGIDGYCCEVGDKLKAKSDKPINYTSIAIKGLLFHYKRPNATITVDGKVKHYKGVWLAPTMKGKYYGGGMMVAPNQDRHDKDNYVTNVVMHKGGKLKTLMVFPSIFKGEHIKHTEMIDINKGHHILVEFDRPTSLQVDGETILGVTRYEVFSK